jgi:hypothetical protein
MDRLFPEMSARCEETRQALREHMARHGLSEGDGWRVYEFTRQGEAGTELVMRPVHTTLNAPAELECVCRVEESQATSECRD